MHDPYKPCWCGSGKKYKFCHRELERAIPVRPHELEEKLRSQLRLGQCMAPPSENARCPERTIAAHTISRGASLSRIARNGHVYALKPSLAMLQRTQGRVVPELIGVRTVSTFYGFCAAHDTELFRSLDRPSSDVDSTYCIAASFRAVSKELVLKQSLGIDDAQLEMLQRGQPLQVQMAIRAMQEAQTSGRRAAERELSELWSDLGQVLRAGGGRWRHLYVRAAAPAPILVSAPVHPIQSVSRKVLQDLNDIQALCRSVILNSVASGAQGGYILSWRLHDEPVARFVDDLKALSPDEIGRFLLAFVLESCENIAIAPDWWDSCSSKQQSGMIAAINRGTLDDHTRSANNALQLAEALSNWSCDALLEIH